MTVELFSDIEDLGVPGLRGVGDADMLRGGGEDDNAALIETTTQTEIEDLHEHGL